MDIFQTCGKINDLILNENESDARNLLIKLLDFHQNKSIPYSELVNHLLKETGLFPYIDVETSNWQSQFAFEAFKVDNGSKEQITLHRDQSFLLKKLLNGNNIAVSAPTSFGKSFVIDAYISIKKPTNVAIIVPTLALTDETRRRIYKKFSGDYKIITTSDVKLSNKNIFIFPQERAINYVDKIPYLDILIIDEFYKASSKFDTDRSPALIKTLLKLGKLAKQKYFLAPNINLLSENLFTRDIEFLRLDFNTVFLEKHEYYKEINKDEKKKSDSLLKILNSKSTKTLIYAGTYKNIEKVTNLLTTNIPIKEREILNDFSSWLGENYGKNWSLTSLAKRGVGIHNGRLHRSLSQIQVKLFEEREGLDTIISTSSIIEGVNTSAENVIIWSNLSGKGRTKLNDFTYKNIMGRGGRMFKHFVGQVYILEEPPNEENTQLDILFPDQILGDLNIKTFENELTTDQVAKISLFNKEMEGIFGENVFERLQNENTFQSSDAELIKKIAVDMKNKPHEWNGLGFLNSFNPLEWDRMLYKILSINKSGWDSDFKTLVQFLKVLVNNWNKSIPELLLELEQFDINIDTFFKLERIVTFKLASILSDINILQKELLKEKKYDISRFVNNISNAFLPKVVYQLEEFGLPRMITKKIHTDHLINFEFKDVEIHSILIQFNKIGKNKILSIPTMTNFDKYIIEYFFEGILIN